MGSQVFHAESTTGQAYQQKDTTPYDVEERKNRLIEIRKSHLPFTSQIEYTTTNGEAYLKPVVRSDNSTQVELNRIYQSNRSTKPQFVLGHDEASYTTVNRRNLNYHNKVCKKYMDTKLSPLEKEAPLWVGSQKTRTQSSQRNSERKPLN